jgi:hypothetical protein
VSIESDRSTDFRNVLAAGLFSAAGSLPLHIAPILVGVLVLSGQYSNSQASAVISLTMLGQLAAAMFLSRLKIQQISPKLWAFQIASYSGGVVASSLFINGIAFYAIWFVIGCVSGCLMQFGILAAASSKRSARAFALRVSIALFISGIASFSIRFLDGNPNYNAIVALVFTAVIIVGLAGLCCTGRRDVIIAPTGSDSHDAFGRHDVIGLVMLTLFFSSVVGFLANSASLAVGNGIEFGDVSAVIGIAKLGISILVVFVFIRIRQLSSQTYLGMALLLSFSIFVVCTQGSIIVVAIAFILFETALNLLSPSFMGLLSDSFSGRAKSMMMTCVLLGLIFGPYLFGKLVELQALNQFMAFSMLGCFVPFAWCVFRLRVR